MKKTKQKTLFGGIPKLEIKDTWKDFKGLHGTTFSQPKAVKTGRFMLLKGGKEAGYMDVMHIKKPVTERFHGRLQRKYPGDMALSGSFEIFEKKDRGKGLGTFLLKGVERKLKAKGVKSFELEQVDNPGFATKRGFFKVGNRYYKKVF